MEPVWQMLNVMKEVVLLQAPVLEGNFSSIYFEKFNIRKKLWIIFDVFFNRFGVCCVFMTSSCGATVSQNCSYIKNPGYSSAYTSTSNCQFTIVKCDNCT